MSKRNKISLSVIRRLPKYYRFLNHLISQDINRISSSKLSEITGLTAPQIRQDLNCFGGFGQQGYGYNVAELKNQVASIIGINKSISAILIGIGNIGKTILTHLQFESMGFKINGVFDNDSLKIGANIAGFQIMDVNYLLDFCSINNPTVAIICLPMSVVGDIVKKLVNNGVRCFWNFSHYDISVEHSNTIVENVHLQDSLLTLCYRVNNQEN